MESVVFGVILVVGFAFASGLVIYSKYEFVANGAASYSAYFPHKLGSLHRCTLLCTNMKDSCKGVNWIRSAGSYACSYTSSFVIDNKSLSLSSQYAYYRKIPSTPTYSGCSEAYKDTMKSGIYHLTLTKDSVFYAYCESNLMRIQMNGVYEPAFHSVSRKWSDYANGFGNLYTSHWIGNNILHILTTAGHYGMKICATKYTYEMACISYDDVVVLSEKQNYTLVLGPMVSGNSTLDISKQHNNSAFVTSDRDNKNGCSALYAASGFWFNNCSQINPNGLPVANFSIDVTNGILFPAFSGYRSLVKTVMYLYEL